MKSSNPHRLLPAAWRAILCCSIFTISSCRSGDPAVPKSSKAEVISAKVDELYKLGFGLVRIDRLNVEGTAVTAAARGRAAADNVSQQSADLGFGYGTSYVNKLREIRKLPRAAVENAVNTRYASDPSAPSNKLVYPVLKRHLSSTYVGLNIDAADAIQDYASVRYMQ